VRCEIIAVGTELLLGQIIDTNSAWLGEQLALAGINSYFQTKVGDNLERITSALQIALQRSDAVILCGGLGPTQDDITREAIAKVMGVRLVRDNRLVEHIRERFRSRNREMPLNNLRQADVPEGASVIPQMPGTAPGLICPMANKVVYAVPGVPFEMREMVTGTVLPDLQRRADKRTVIKSRTLRTWGQSESGLAEMLAERIAELDRLDNPTLAFLASGIEGIKVRITARATDEAAALHLLDAEEHYLRNLLGQLIFGTNEQTMEAMVIELLRNHGFTLGVAENLTGGLLSSRLTMAPGADDVFRGALVCRANAIPFTRLNIPEGSLLSPTTVKAAALGISRLLGTDIGLAATGVDAAEDQSEYPIGTVCLGLAVRGEAEAQQLRLPGRREQLRQFTVISLLNWIRLRIGNMN
jgi:nicotinamide-nucleotide amidase